MKSMVRHASNFLLYLRLWVYSFWGLLGLRVCATFMRLNVSQYILRRLY